MKNERRKTPTNFMCLQIFGFNTYYYYYYYYYYLYYLAKLGTRETGMQRRSATEAGGRGEGTWGEGEGEGGGGGVDR